MPFSDETLALAARMVEVARSADARITTAESCTGGLIAGAITSVSGASHVFSRGFVTYANEAKSELLGIDPAVISRVGAVSEEVARAMAEGALRAADADAAVAVTGIAGPDGGSAEKPVGLVHVAAARGGHPTLHRRHVFSGDRASIRAQAVDAALRLLLRIMGETA
ncbi:MAG: CinA family protein [Alphaproteobacteria bacterium]